MRHAKVEKRITTPDKVYKSIMVAKVVNRIMKDGKKTIAQKLVYSVLESIREKGLEPVETLEKALANIAPKVEIKARRVGGANYQVPVEVRGDRRISLPIRWLIQAAESRSSKDYHGFDKKLFAEIMEAIENKGEAIKKRDNMHRQAEANKAFSSFRF